jgi:Domain of unknown function (DUF5658)
MRLYVRICAVAILGFAVPASAQTSSDKFISISALAAESVVLDALPAEVAATPALPVVATVPKATNSPAIPLLYAGMIALQAMDIVSTHKALSRPGTYEANPVFGSVGGSLGAQIAMKAGATAGIIYLTERMRKTNKVGAIVTMVVLNSAYATLVAHNYAAGLR